MLLGKWKNQSWLERLVSLMILSTVFAIFGGVLGAYQGHKYAPEQRTTPQTSVSTKQVSDTKPTVKELHKLVNAEREKRELNPLELYQPLNNSAADKCGNMVGRAYFDHSDPAGKPFYESIKKYTYYENAGENLARNYATAKETVLAWMKSKTHKANILNPNFNFVGHYVCNTDTDVYIVQHLIQL